MTQDSEKSAFIDPPPGEGGERFFQAAETGGVLPDESQWGRWLGRVSLTALIAIFSGLIVVSIWVLIVYEAGNERKLAVEAIYRENANLARAFEEHSIRTLKSVDQSVLFLKFQYEKLGMATNVAGYVREGMIISTIFNQLGIIDEHGMYVLSSLPDFKPMDLSDREHFKVHIAKDSNELFISKPVLGRASGKWSIQMTRRINKPDGSFGGAVTVSLDPFYFSSFYSGVNLGRGGLVALIGKDGFIRARRAGEDTSVGQDVSKSQLFEHLKTAPEGSYTASSPVDKVTRLYSYRSLKGYPLVVLVGVAENEALAEFYNRRDAYIALAAVASLLVLAFAALLISMVRRQQRIAESLRLSQERAESANRMKSDFLANMSHELRTPLNGILGYAEYLADDCADATQKEFARTIESSGQHLLMLVNDILDLAKIEAGRMELIESDEPLAAMLQELVALHGSAARTKGLKLELELTDHLPATLRCDRTRLLQVLNNLVHNAIKFTSAGSVVLAVSRRGEDLLFEVRDSGCGIPPAALSSIFEKFRQADPFITRSHGGTGLGLALAKNLVELMGGRIGLESQQAVGTRVYFTLPGNQSLAHTV